MPHEGEDAAMKKAWIVIAVSFAAALVFLASCRNGASTGGAAGSSATTGSSITENKEVIRTYPFSDPDPVPIFARLGTAGGARLYPYYFYNTFSTTGIDKEWTVVRMENPYISVAVLPQVGGKVWGAADKAAKRDFLYTNHVLKFREIALRGPWTSGGIEFNFGIVGHAPSTATPVDYVLRSNADGSVSCVVGALDLPSRTRWSVAVTLPKDKAYFETTGAWYNPSLYSQSYYYWSCAAIKTAEDLRYIFPGRFQIGHNYNVPLTPWPVDPWGRDLSWYKNNAFPDSKSYFTVGEYEEFYGAWYKTSDSGFGHWALYDDMPGRKVWIWDESRAGEIWVDLLTDKDGQYTEPQAGRLLNQSDHEMFTPGRADRWREIWFPYGGIGPMTESSPFGVMSAEAGADSLKVGIYALQALDDDLVIASAGKELHRERLALKPSQSLKKELKLSLGDAPFTVKVGEKLVYQSDPGANDLKRPLVFKAPDESTADGLYQAGLQQEKARYFDLALQKYEACLAKDPGHLRALSRAAEIRMRRGEYDLARGLARKALEIGMYDPGANYVYGILARRTGELIDAREALGWAARSLEFRPAAYTALAEIALGESRFDQAVDYARRSIEANAFASSGYEIMAAAHRKAGRPEEARAAIRKLFEIDPLDHLGRFETYLLDKTPKALEEFQSLIRNEIPHESYIEMALSYMRWNLDDDARALLELAPAHPTVYSMLAFFNRRSAPDKSKDYLTKALALSPQLVFPFREEEILLYQWVAAERPGDWKPKYYLGLILWGQGRADEALELFKQCDAADFAPFFQARAALVRVADPVRALADFEKAVKLDGATWRTWHALAEFQLQQGHADKSLATALVAAGRFANDTPVQVDLIKAYLAAGKDEEAAAIFDKIDALPYEGASEIHSLYAQAHVRLGLKAARNGDWAGAVAALERSKEYPEKLGSGKPFEPDTRLQDYFEYLAFKNAGQAGKAKDALASVADYTLKHPDGRSVGAYFGGLALGRLGQGAKAADVLKNAPRPAKDVMDALSALNR
jgi:tetratricopeptide (TPR) repeat protein